MSIVANYKQEVLRSVSHATLRFGCAAAAIAQAEQAQSGALKYGVEGFLIWLRIWLNWLSGERMTGSSYSTRDDDDEVNRHRRRMNKRSFPVARLRQPLHDLCGKGLSRTQFLELECKLSLRGRIRVYGLRYAGSVLQRRALLICYDHGWWRTPIGDFGRVYCGLWPIFIWVNWCFISSPKTKKPRAFLLGARFSYARLGG